MEMPNSDLDGIGGGLSDGTLFIWAHGDEDTLLGVFVGTLFSGIDEGTGGGTGDGTDDGTDGETDIGTNDALSVDEAACALPDEPGWAFLTVPVVGPSDCGLLEMTDWVRVGALLLGWGTWVGTLPAGTDSGKDALPEEFCRDILDGTVRTDDTNEGRSDTESCFCFRFDESLLATSGRVVLGASAGFGSGNVLFRMCNSAPMGDPSRFKGGPVYRDGVALVGNGASVGSGTDGKVGTRDGP